MQEPLSSVVEDNTESIIEDHYEADEATAIVHEEHEDPKRFMLEVKYEGDLMDGTEETQFVYDNDDHDEIQMVRILNVVDETTLLASYHFRPEDTVEEVKRAIAEA